MRALGYAAEALEEEQKAIALSGNYPQKIWRHSGTVRAQVSPAKRRLPASRNSFDQL